MVAKAIPGVTKASVIKAASKDGNFGPRTWYGLHALALNQPRDECKSTHDFALFLRTSFAKALSCSVCKRHFKMMLRHVPPEEFAEYGRIGMVTLIHLYHALVNASLNKPKAIFLKFEALMLKQHHAPANIIKELRKDAKDYGLRKIINTIV